MATSKKPHDADDNAAAADTADDNTDTGLPADPKAAFKAALERKQAQGGGGRSGGSGPVKPSAGSTKAAGGRRTFQRKSGSA